MQVTHWADHIPREHLENIHYQRVNHMTVLGTQRVKAIKDNELRIVVGLLEDQCDEA